MFGAKYSRTYYWVITIALAIFFAFGSFHIMQVFLESGDAVRFEESSNILFIITYILWLNTLANRIRDYGSRASMALLTLIPFVNVFMLFYYGIVQYKNKAALESVESPKE